MLRLPDTPATPARRERIRRFVAIGIAVAAALHLLVAVALLVRHGGLMEPPGGLLLLAAGLAIAALLTAGWVLFANQVPRGVAAFVIECRACGRAADEEISFCRHCGVYAS